MAERHGLDVQRNFAKAWRRRRCNVLLLEPAVLDELQCARGVVKSLSLVCIGDRLDWVTHHDKAGILAAEVEGVGKYGANIELPLHVRHTSSSVEGLELS